MPSRFVCLLALAVVAITSGRAASAAQPARPRSHTEVGYAVLEGTARGMSALALVERQKATAHEHWRTVFKKDDPPHLETRHFLLFGTVPGKTTLKDVGAALEKQLAMARKALEMDNAEPWPGKLAVHLFADNDAYRAFIRGAERRLPEQGERGSMLVEDDAPHVVAGPPQDALHLKVELHAGERMAALLLKRNFGANVPLWVWSGFGRATVFAAGPPRDLLAELGRGAALVRQNKRSASEVIAGNLPPEELPFLRGSLVYYLAYSGRTARFVPFLTGFRPTKMVPNPTTDTALTAATFTAERLDQLWKNWLIGSK
jgi:hypothetical protein